MSILEGIFPANLSLDALSQAPDELSHVENGRLFVVWPKPPRVGSRVRIELSVGDKPAVSIDALVVWSRPARAGVTGAFRAQLASPPPWLMTALRELAGKARRQLLLEQVGLPSRTTVGGQPFEALVVHERMSAQPPHSNRASASLRPPTSPVPADPPVSASESAPPPNADEFELDFDRKGGWTEVPLPLGRQTIELDVGEGPELQLDLGEPEPILVPFASPKSFLVHYERFLKQGEVYIVSAPFPAPGSLVSLQLDIPDGSPSLLVKAEAKRQVHPPEVPRAGWIAVLIDPDGVAAERLSTASYVASF